MIHFGIKRVVYSVNISSNNWFYGDDEYKKIFKISFWNNSITISSKSCPNKIDEFDLFVTRKNKGYKSVDHFGRIRADRNYTIKLKIMRSNNSFDIRVREGDLRNISYGDHFKLPLLLFGCLTKGKHENMIINRIDD